MSLRRPMIRAILALVAFAACNCFAPTAVMRAFAAAPGDAVADAPLSRDTLAKMYRIAMGPKFDPANVQQIYAAHDLLEEYFKTTSAADHKRIAGQIATTGVDPGIVGRLARLRINWTPLSPGVYYINDKIGPNDVRYFLGIPKTYDLTHAWPLVVKLPAVNAFATDQGRDAAKTTAIYTDWINDELTNHPDALVIMPLLNLDDAYGPDTVGMNLVMQPILHAANKANIDPTRVYLFGHSMSAHAVWNIAIHYPTYFAAINPMAGAVHESWQRVRLGNLRNVLPVVWHDASDPVISVNESREVVRYLKTLNFAVDYTESPNLGHAPSPQIVAQEYAKVRSRVRELYPREEFLQSNRPDTIYNRVDWVQMYQPINSGKDQKIIFSRGSQGMTIQQNSTRVVADLTGGNEINIATVNVQSLRIYLNDQMVDFTKPVHVIANGKDRYNALVPQSIEEMLKDQTFLGRGWRYFTGVIDLDLLDAPASRPADDTASAKDKSATDGAENSPPTTRRVIEYTTPDGEVKTYTPPGN